MFFPFAIGMMNLNEQSGVVRLNRAQPTLQNQLYSTFEIHFYEVHWDFSILNKLVQRYGFHDNRLASRVRKQGHATWHWFVRGTGDCHCAIALQHCLVNCAHLGTLSQLHVCRMDLEILWQRLKGNHLSCWTY